MKKHLIILLGFALSFGANAQTSTITVDGLEREYIFYKPSELPPQAPLVFVFHGYSGSASGIRNYSKMNLLANQFDFAVCYPQGTIDEWGSSFWQVGYSFHANEPVDDVDFVKRLAQKLHTEHDLDPAKTFSTGMSNGGDLSYYLACAAPELFAAVAPVAGCMMQWYIDACDNDVRMPVFAIHGTNDNTTWWEGDINDTQGYGPYLGVESAIQFWRTKNNTSTEKVTNLPNRNTSDGSTVTSFKHEGPDNYDVWLHQVNNGGHDWPGSSGNMDIDASLEIWKFFSHIMNEEVVTSALDQTLSGSEPEVKIYPNPFDEYLVIEMDSAYFGTLSIDLLSLDGSVVAELYRGKDYNSIIRLEEIFGSPIKNLAPGGYLLQIAAENMMFTKRVILIPRH